MWIFLHLRESTEKGKALAARMKLYSHGETVLEHLLFGTSKLGNTHRAEPQNPETKHGLSQHGWMVEDSQSQMFHSSPIPVDCTSSSEPRGKDRVRKTHGCFLFENIIQLHHFSLSSPTYNLIHILFLDSFKSTVSLLWVYTYIPKYNQFSLCNVICKFSELTIWYWTVSSCVCPQRKLFLLL